MTTAEAQNQQPENNNENDEQQQQHHQHQNDNNTIVEIATLILPSHAIEEGMEAGDGDHVILEALPETLENLASDMQQQEEQQQIPLLPQHAPLSEISAVVDLEVLSELVGISEAEFINDLQQANQELAQEAERATEAAEAKAIKEDAQEKHPDEETPLLAGRAGDREEVTADTHPDRLTLPADPFIESLADVLPTTSTLVEDSPHHIEEEFCSDSVAQSQTSPHTQTHTHEVNLTEAAATKTEEDQHMGHDAFLLNIPNETSDGEMEDHFVLALPEIFVESSVAASTLDGSITNKSITSSYREETVLHPILERAMSILPGGHLPNDVEHVHLEAHKHLLTNNKEGPSELHLDLIVKHKVPVIGYVILIAGLVALASVGAALDLQVGPSPTMKTIWRQMATSIVLLPLVIKSLYHDGMPELKPMQWIQLVASAMAYAYMTLAFVIALEMTTMANAFVLSNMTSLVIIAGRVALGLPILRAEGFGAVVGFVGAAICANDASRTLAKAAALMTAGSIDTATIHHNDPMLGNIIALSASFGTAFYLIVAKSLRSSMDLFVFMFCIMMFGSLFLLCYIIINGEDFSFGIHPDHGLFGWVNMTPDRFPLEMYMAIVCNCLGTTGYIAVMKYFDPIVPATVMLMEPVVGALLGVASRTTKLPGMQTWFGDVVVAAGTYCVIWAGSKKTETIDATSALRPATGDDETVATVTKSPLIRKPSASQRRSANDAPPAKVVWDHN